MAGQRVKLQHRRTSKISPAIQLHNLTRISFKCWIHTKKFNSMSDVTPFMVTQIKMFFPARLNDILLSATGIV